MIKSRKFAVIASLILGTTMVGGMGAGAAPLSNMPTSIQSEVVANKTDVEKTSLLLGLGIGALVGGFVVHEHDRYYNHHGYGRGYHGGKKGYARHHRGHKSKSPHHKSMGHKRAYHH